MSDLSNRLRIAARFYIESHNFSVNVINVHGSEGQSTITAQELLWLADRIEELEAALRRIDKLDISPLPNTTRFLITNNIRRALEGGNDE